MKRKAFTLIELMVVIFIIIILIALLYPAISAAKTAAKNAQKTKDASAIIKAPSGLEHTIRSFTYEKCEYLIIDESSHGQAVTHKGNCKYCTERNR